MQQSFAIATFNVNSIRSRMHQLMPWLESKKPAVVLLQELKCEAAAFPALEIESLGYNLAICGQKSYNGVAILSLFPLEDIVQKLPGEESDEQARYIEALARTPLGMMRLASVYVPNGQEVGSDKFHYKLRFLERLKSHIESLKVFREMLVVGGDFNVAYRNADVYAPRELYGSVCFHPEEQARFRAILNSDMLDAFRLQHPENDGTCPYSWWDYRGGAFEHNKGLRIDHILLSPEAADHMQDAFIERDMRAVVDKASDHAPVVATFA